jgi:hypothetical protein
MTILWGIGERACGYGFVHHGIDFYEIGRELIEKQPDVYKDALSDALFLEYILEDHQIVLSKSIAANRILKIIPPAEEFGRVIYKQNKMKYVED